MKIFIETERLIFREIVFSDVESVFELDSDPQVVKYIENKPIETLEQAHAEILSIRQQYYKNGIGRWAIIEKDSNQFVGWSGLKYMKENINNCTHYYEVGYRLLRKYWGKGYATESAKASIAYGFSNLNLTTVYAMANCNHVASKNVLTKAGFTFIENFILNGTPHSWFKINKI